MYGWVARFWFHASQDLRQTDFDISLWKSYSDNGKVWAWFWTGREGRRRRRTPADQKDTGGSLLREDATKTGLPGRLTEIRLRQSYDAGRAAHQTCHSTKRTHRFAIENRLLSIWLAMSCAAEERRFSVGSFWKTNPPEGGILMGLEAEKARNGANFEGS
jgi:hypothetical protein